MEGKTLRRRGVPALPLAHPTDRNFNAVRNGIFRPVVHAVLGNARAGP